MTPPVTVLVVDDSAQIRRMLQVMLEVQGYHVLQAWNGMAALRIAREKLPPVILTDLEMPMMDGYDACRRLKADPRTAQLKVVIISTEIDDGVSQAAAQIGVDAYLSKPAQLSTLHACLEQLLSTVPHP